jgi:hypothetical protein
MRRREFVRRQGERQQRLTSCEVVHPMMVHRLEFTRTDNHSGGEAATNLVL